MTKTQWNSFWFFSFNILLLRGADHCFFQTHFLKHSTNYEQIYTPPPFCTIYSYITGNKFKFTPIIHPNFQDAPIVSDTGNNLKVIQASQKINVFDFFFRILLLILICHFFVVVSYQNICKRYISLIIKTLTKGKKKREREKERKSETFLRTKDRIKLKILNFQGEILKIRLH